MHIDVLLHVNCNQCESAIDGIENVRLLFVQSFPCRTQGSTTFIIHRRTNRKQVWLMSLRLKKRVRE